MFLKSCPFCGNDKTLKLVEDGQRCEGMMSDTYFWLFKIYVYCQKLNDTGCGARGAEHVCTVKDIDGNPDETRIDFIQAKFHAMDDWNMRTE